MKKVKNETNFKKDVSNLIYGRNPLLSFIANGQVQKVYLQEGFKDKRILDEIHKSKTPTEYVSVNELNRLTNSANHQGVVGLIKPFQYSSLSEIIANSKKSVQPLVVILDGINDPQNLGAIIRSCDAFNVDGLIIKSHNQVPVNMTVTKVSTGATNYVKIAVVANLSNAIKELKKNGFWVYASDGKANEDYSKQNYRGSVALILGSEGDGISPLVLQNSDIIIKIPMMGHVNSLNVSVATGILLSRIRQ